MRVIDIDNQQLHIPDGWTAFLFNGVLYTVSDDGVLTRHDKWDVEQASIEQLRDLDAREVRYYDQYRENYEKAEAARHRVK